MNLLGEKTDMVMKELVIDYSKNTKVIELLPFKVIQDFV